MATSVQTLPVTRGPTQNFRSPFPSSPLSSLCGMGSVGSLVEKPDVSPTKGNRAVPQVRPRQTNGLLKKGLTQRELLNYLNITRKEPKAGPSGNGKRDVIGGLVEDDVFAKVYSKDGTEIDLSKNSLPSGGKYEKVRFRSSAFKPVTPKNFSSMQNLYPSSKSEDVDHGLSNGLHRAYGHISKTVSTSSSSSSPSRHGGPTSCGNKAISSVQVMSHEDDNLSDSGHNSMSSLPPYRPPFRPHLSHISASMGHINTIGSLDRTSQGLKAAGSGGMAMGEVACRSMATLNRLTPYGSEAPPPYEWTLSLSVEDVVRDLEERLVEKEHELKQMRRNLDESEGAIAQVFEGKQRLWEKEVEELKRLYAAKLRQVSQHAQRSQRSMQLELFRAQQEKNRLQEELDGLKRDAVRDVTAVPKPTSPTLEETRWEVCQKSGEISLLKQQVRDSQAEVTQKLSEIFKLKTQLRETRTELRNREAQIDALNIILQGTQRGKCSSAGESKKGAEESPSAGATGGSGGPTEERLRAELLLERRQSEAQATAFEEERNTWQTEKDKVIRYQKELQASYLEMYHRNEALERELQQLRAGGAQEGRGGGGGGEGGSRDGTTEKEAKEPTPDRAAGKQEDTPSSSLPWIDRIESSEI
ncbi:NEDD4-binding protein 3-B [Xiphophorus couchianus]|uniref:NEDD4-binding protein 3-B n=1 Tax=Xiphophorus couchianus TaxID=32473 RepID=UPI001016EB09|nr:NEDD4-binding protein 3-B-like [Xiphophorus couchianus]XP_027864481.1 NEDD4-binding protein 3-B-like [Xiphophorus couchianus]XP_027864482.1 NEDD4-binding protein 3-B-like [Xiphophorus couchianus]XP_027864483.1 NEDD4-binding protein 3-B-like [Xiphophorus couchianus]XP_027864484.1 NEDD4-binding protein 3-B-like [Xiphophorus couchianus]XP_027864485.1 NEDD4-binding protein 3-B-like [Xiphophorus couchianus]